MKYLKLFLRKHWGKTALSLLLLLGQVVGTLLIPYLVAGVVDQGILKGDQQAILRLGFWMLVVAIVSTAVSVWGSWATSDLGALFGSEMRGLLFRKSQQLSLAQFDMIGVSSMITRATSDISSLQQTMGMLLQLVVPAPLIVVTAVIMTAMVSAPMAAMQILALVVLLLFSQGVLRRSHKLSAGVQARLDRINRVVRESITGVRVIRAFANEQREQQRSGQAFEAYADQMIRLNRLFAMFAPAVWLMLGLMLGATMSLGGAFTLKGSMAVGEITAVCEYAIITLSYLMMGTAVLSTLPKARACLERLSQVLDTDAAIVEIEQPSALPLLGDCAVRFSQVRFAYPGAEEPVIHDLSFECRRGQTTAIIGSTGSGKSTLVDLLLRLHDVGAGQINLCGVDIRQLSQSALRKAIGCVPQKAFLFSGSIAENLRMGNPDASDQALWEALSIAQAESFVRSLPKGLYSPVSQGGTNFSGGQRQRLSIARALVKNAPVLVFDDSFSALDTKTDAALRVALSQRVTSSAKLIVSQRVSSILDADQILVLDEGRLVGLGTHAQLLLDCAIYRDIHESQSGGKEGLIQ